MRLHLPALFALAALAVGCSSGSDDSATDPDSNGGQFDDQNALLDAGNFDTLLAGGLELLRAEYYVDAIALLAEVALAWEQPQQAVVGATEHDCPGGGQVSRTVTEATDSSVSPPVYKLVSDLIFTDCTAGSRVLNGTVGWNWNQSSPAQIASSTFTNDYRFVDFSMSRPDGSEILSGNVNESVTIAGQGDFYTRAYSTQRYEGTDANDTVLLTDGSYTQNFEHSIGQPGPGNGLAHQFKERGTAVVSKQSLGMSNATVSIDPEIIYANVETDSSTLHTTALESGAAQLRMSDGSRVDVTVIAAGNDTLIYTLTAPDGQQTTIEREWVSPAICRPDGQFNYESC